MKINQIKYFSEDEIKKLSPTEKVGLTATIDPTGLPHITLITSLMAISGDKLIWGQFIEGLSKEYIKKNSKCAFLIMNRFRKMWRGRALYTHSANSGSEYELLNNKPMFRYNSYFGINTVHYMNLVERSQEESLPLVEIISASLLTMLIKKIIKKMNIKSVINDWTLELINKMDTLKFLAYVREDGYPKIVPIVQCRSCDKQRVIFSFLAYNNELQQIKEGSTVAIYALSLTMESVLLRGIFSKVRYGALAEFGVVNINWVYNSMIPKHSQIYPRQEIETIRNFN